MRNLLEIAYDKGWKVEAVAHDVDRNQHPFLHVVIYRISAPYSNAKYSYHRFSLDTFEFHMERFDLTREQAFEHFKERIK